MSKSNRKNRAGHTPMDVTLMYHNINISQSIQNLLSEELKIHRILTISFIKNFMNN